ncbi:MAG: sensor histidine kinase [Acidobacteriota bacterium]
MQKSIIIAKLTSDRTVAFVTALVILACFLAALRLEQPSPQRLLWLVLLAAGLIVVNSLSIVYRKLDASSELWTYVLQVLLLYTLEQNSRFVINYYLHLIYFVIILRAGIQLSRPAGFIAGLGAFMVGMIKFVVLLRLDSSSANESLTVYSLFAGVTILMGTSYGRYMADNNLLVTRMLHELEAYSQQIRELSAVAERNRIAREIHDSMGHSLTALIMELEICQRMIARNPEEAIELMEKIKGNARSGLREVRCAVEALHPHSMNSHATFMESIEALAASFEKSSGLTIILEGVRDLPALLSQAALTVYRVIQECLTNTGRHGNADKVTIQLNCNNNILSMLITDNGQGVKNIKPGYGLLGIRERVEECGGKVMFDTGRNTGFTVNVEIPYAESYSKMSGQEGETNGEQD